MLKSSKHFYRLIKSMFILDVIKYYWVVLFCKKSDKSFSFKLNNGLRIIIVPKAGDYCAFHEIFIREDYLYKNNSSPHFILDIGANVGFFSLYAANQFRKSKIYSFEPFPSTYLRLKEHISINNMKNIFTFPFAVSDRNEKVNFYSINWSGANTLNSDKFDTDNCVITQVDCISFTEIFRLTEVDSFDLAKIDCEGSEYPMLINAPAESILRIRSYIIEVHNDKKYSADDLIEKFIILGYKTEYKKNILFAAL